MTPLLIALLFAVFGLLLFFLPVPPKIQRVGEILAFWGIFFVVAIAVGRPLGL